MSEFYIDNKSITEEELYYETKASIKLKHPVPRKLYKYYSFLDSKDENGKIVNHSFEALKNNTIYLQDANKFDDTYDSFVNIESEKLFLQRIIYYTKLAGFIYNDEWNYKETIESFAKSIIESIRDEKDLEDVFKTNEDISFLNLSHKCFAGHLRKYLCIFEGEESGIYFAIEEAIREEIKFAKKALLEYFKISCFTTSPYLVKMWSEYADCSRGFCVEYDIPAIEDFDERYIDIYPVIYGDKIISVHDVFLNHLAGNDMNDDDLNKIFKFGLLAKNAYDWQQQDEWRFIRYVRNNDSNIVPFYKITKVFIGDKMSHEKRKKLISFCNENNIEYVGLTKSESNYDLIECPIKCDDCFRYKYNI